VNRPMEMPKYKSSGSSSWIVAPAGGGFALGFWILILVIIASAWLLRSQDTAQKSSVALKVLSDPDGLLSPELLPPSSDAWSTVESLPIEISKGITWLLINTGDAPSIDLATKRAIQMTLLKWDPITNQYKSQQHQEGQLLSLDGVKQEGLLLQLNSAKATTLSTRTATEAMGAAELQTLASVLLVIALMSWLLLVLNEGLQLYLLRDQWQQHALSMLSTTAILFILLSQSELLSYALDLSFSSLSALSWVLLSCSEFFRITTEQSYNQSRMFRNVGISLCLLGALILPTAWAVAFMSVMTVALVGLRPYLGSKLCSLILGGFYTLLALNHTLLRPLWSDDHLVLQIAVFIIFSILAFVSMIDLTQNYATQKSSYDKLQFQLHHEHSARLYITSSTAHELNNPINFISSGVGLQLEQFGELRDLVDIVFYDVDDPDAIDLKTRFDATLRSILNITLDIQAGALRSAASLEHLRGLSPANNQIVTTFWSLRDIVSHALDRVELQYSQSARTLISMDLSPTQADVQLSTNLYFLADAIGKLLIIALSQSPQEPQAVRVHQDIEHERFRVVKISYPGSLPNPGKIEENIDRLDQLEHVSQCLRLINCQIVCTHHQQTKSSTLSVYIPKSGARYET